MAINGCWAAISDKNRDFYANLANFVLLNWVIKARIKQMNLKRGYGLHWGQRNNGYNHSKMVGRQLIGVGPRFLKRNVIFMPIWPILSPEIALQRPEQINNQRNCYKLNWRQSNNVINQSKLVSRQIICFSLPFLPKIVILCQFDHFCP